MTSGFSMGRAIAGGAILWTLAVPAAAQRGQSTEDFLLARQAGQPHQLQSYLDLATFYYSQRRYDETDRVLTNALKLVRQARTTGRAPSPPAAEPTEPVVPQRIGAGISTPTKLREVKPDYPRDALERRVGGSVMLEVVVDRRGLVSDARVTRSVTELDEAAVAAVRQWEFVPAFLNGATVPVIIDVRLTFIPEALVTATPPARRQVATVFGLARRHFDLRAYAQAETVLDVVATAIRRERNETGTAAATPAAAVGVTTSDWPVRGGRDVNVPQRIKDVRPMYPPDALSARTGGLVSFELVVDEQGKPTNLRRLGSFAATLEQAARDAVQQWEFAPTVVGGEPVPVAIAVAFAFVADRGTIEEVVRVGNEIAEPKKVKHVPPRYPSEAQAQRLQGSVIIEAIIDRTGKVSGARIIRSAGDLLDRAALEAVQQWEFTPTTLSGIPVSVVMTVTVNFTLN